jgi:predicted nucleic acid-binding protein
MSRSEKADLTILSEKGQVVIPAKIRANYIISGDRHLLALTHFKGIRILTVDEMLFALNN